MARNLATVLHGGTLQVTVPASNALVLSWEKQQGHVDRTVPLLLGQRGVIAQRGRHLEISAFTATGGTSADARVVAHDTVDTLSVNDVNCTRQRALATARIPREHQVRIAMKGNPLQRMMAASQTSPPADATAFDAEINITAAMKEQLSNRARAYPVKWDPSDYKASWLVPTRLLLYLFIEKPIETMNVTMTLDGRPAGLTKAYNSRGRGGARCFLGFYCDLSATPVGTHAVSVGLQGVPAGAFKGLFFENIEDEPSSLVAECTWG